MAVPEDQPSSPWRSDYWPTEMERVRARREIARMREVLAAKGRHPTGRRNRERTEKSSATG